MARRLQPFRTATPGAPGRPPPRSRSRARARRRDWGRVLAQTLTLIFALIGAVPLGIGVLVRTAAVRRWAARETAGILERELGVVARYRVRVDAWPFALGLEDLTVDGSDGLGPAFQVARIVVRPRIFSLLSGRIDAGDIEIDAPRVRLVSQKGALTNVAYHLPEQRGGSHTLGRKAPFLSVAITDGEVDLDLDGLRLHGGDIDLDVSALDGPSFDVAVRAGNQRIRREREVLDLGAAAGATPPERAVDDDVLCNLDARLHVAESGLLIRRLTASGAVDADPAEGGTPGCALPADDERRVELDLSQVRVIPHAGGTPEFDGRVHARVPIALTNRFVPFLPLRGFVSADLDVHDAPGRKLPTARGSVGGHGLALGRYHLAQELALKVDLEGDVIRVSRGTVGFADGTVTLTDLLVEPFKPGVPLRLAAMDAADVRFPAMMRDLGVTPHAHVTWTYRTGHIATTQGTLVPLRLDADFVAQTGDFEVFDRAIDDPARRHMIGVKDARAAGHVAVRPDALTFSGAHVDFGDSHIETSVALGFHNDIVLHVAKGSTVDLANISPLAALKMGGKATLSAEMTGKFDNPVLTGELAVSGLSLDDFPLGDVTSSKVRFVPLIVDFTEVHGVKGKTSFEAPSARLDFNGPASLLADASVDASVLDVRDFLHMWRFDADPRFADIAGQGRAKARIHYDLGGPADICGNGLLTVRGGVHLDHADLFDEPYDGVDTEFSYRWVDRDAQDLGIDVDIETLVMKKGRGAIIGSGTIRRGGALRARLVADEIPLARMRSLGPLAKLVDGTASATVTLDGTLDELIADADVRVSPLRLGPSSLPASHLSLALSPIKREKKVIGHTKCGAPITPPFDRAEFDQDPSQGVFHATGQLFGNQIAFNDFRVTRQRSRSSSGAVAFDKLDIGALLGGFSTSASAPALSGSLSGDLNVESLNAAAPQHARAVATIKELEVRSPSGRVVLKTQTPSIKVAEDKLEVPKLDLGFSTPSGLSGSLRLGGEVGHLSGDPDLDLAVVLTPLDLAALAPLIPRVERMAGSLEASLSVRGKASAPVYNGEGHVKKGEVVLRGFESPLSDVNIDLAIASGEIRVVKGAAMVGGGEVTITGHAPIHGLEIGDAVAAIKVRGVHLPVVDGVEGSFDADLAASIPKSSDEDRDLPKISGDVTLTSFNYTRPIVLAADIGAIAQGSRRKTFETYDPADDFVSFDLSLRSRQPLRLRNNLVEAQLTLDEGGLALMGTNQRFGARGQLRVLPAGRLRLRSNEFEIRQGYVRFDDVTRIAPTVDVTAVTEYHRYSDAPGSAAGAASTSGGASGGSGRTGGIWRITLHAHGDAENLRLEMTSEPALSQEDIVLLLTLGMTRAELDQLQASQAGSLGGTAALEALSTLTGADSAVRKAVPVIDDFRFGNAYSSRSGRTEATVTVGKRVTEQLRANVTSGLSENREIRSNLEWKLTPRVSVQGSYDNVNDVSSSSFGNLGADVRYRLEF